MRIVHISPEVTPFAKTGGLADVVGALPQALAALGHEVRVIMPLHRGVLRGREGLTGAVSAISVPVQGGYEEGAVRQGKLDKDVSIYFIEKEKYFDRDYLYGTPQGDYPDNAERFSFFSRAALETVAALGLKPDILHCHDWQSALVPLYLKLFYRQRPNLSRAATLLTVHNLAYQGLFPDPELATTGIPADYFTPRGIEYYGRVSFLKAGLLYADAVTTVSEKYSREIQTPEYGYGLEGVLRERARDLYGIINGVDYKEWDPATDRDIVARYDPKNMGGKRRCKADLLKTLNLKGLEDKPLLGMISRMADQKGFDILVEGMDRLMALDIGLVILGAGEERYQRMLAEMPERFPGLAVRIAFDNALAHKIEAGCDIFLMPSKYEPCGLNQIYSLKYGTIPVVRATGGLDDTIEDFDPGTGRGNGFKFTAYSHEDMVAKVEEAVNLFNRDEEGWKRLMQNAMACDYSWSSSAAKYLEVYRKAIDNRG